MIRTKILFLLLILLFAESALAGVQGASVIRNPGDYAPPNDGLISDDFGRASATDGNTLVVLSPNDRNVLVPDTYGVTGSVYIYERSSQGWLFTQKLFVEEPTSIAIESNVLVVGSSGRRAISIFERRSSVWTESARFTSNGLNLPQNIGAHVSTTRGRVLTTAGNVDVYIFSKDANGWSLAQVLTPAPNNGLLGSDQRVLNAKDGRVFFNINSTDPTQMRFFFGYELSGSEFIRVFSENVNNFSDKYVDQCGNTLFLSSRFQQNIITFERSNNGNWVRSSDISTLLGPSGFNIYDISCSNDRLAVAYSNGSLGSHIFRRDGQGWEFEDTIETASESIKFADNLFITFKPKDLVQNKNGSFLTYKLVPNSRWSVIQEVSPGPNEPQDFGFRLAANNQTLIVGTGSLGSEHHYFVYEAADQGWQFDEKLEIGNEVLGWGSGTPFLSSGQLLLQGKNGLLVYSNLNGRWTISQRVNLPDGAEAFDLSVDGDTAALGSRRSTNSGTIRAVFVLRKENAVWRISATIEQQGPWVAVRGGILVSVDNSGPNSAAVNFFRLTNGNWSLQQTSSQFPVVGPNIAISEDGSVAAEDSNDSVVVFGPSGMGWSQPQRIIRNGFNNGSGFGQSLEFINGSLFIGYIDRNASRDQSAIGAYRFNGQAWTSVPLTFWNPAIGLPYGIVKELSGDRIVIGAPETVGSNSLNASSGAVAIVPLSIHLNGFE